MENDVDDFNIWAVRWGVGRLRKSLNLYQYKQQEPTKTDWEQGREPWQHHSSYTASFSSLVLVVAEAELEPWRKYSLSGRLGRVDLHLPKYLSPRGSRNR